MTDQSIMSTWWANLGLQAGTGDMKGVWMGIAKTMGVTAASGWSGLVIYMGFQTLTHGIISNIWKHLNGQHWDFTSGYYALCLTYHNSIFRGFLGYFASQSIFLVDGYILAILPEYFSEIMDLSWLLCQTIYLKILIFLATSPEYLIWIDRFILLNIFPS